MTEIRTVTTLRAKREEVQASIRLYEDRIKQARTDLAHVTACIKIFEASGDTVEMPRYVDVHRIFTRGEPIALCAEARQRPKINPKTCPSRDGLIPETRCLRRLSRPSLYSPFACRPRVRRSPGSGEGNRHALAAPDQLSRLKHALWNCLLTIRLPLLYCKPRLQDVGKLSVNFLPSFILKPLPPLVWVFITDVSMEPFAKKQSNPFR